METENDSPDKLEIVCPTLSRELAPSRACATDDTVPLNRMWRLVIKSKWTRQLRDKGHLRAERRSSNSNFKVYIIRIVNCSLVVESTELLGIKWKYSPTKAFLTTEWKIPEQVFRVECDSFC